MRAAEWFGPPIPADLLDRRVELTGPVSRKMIINALNSAANCYMGDFEDSTSPTWFNVIDGQINCRDAVRRTIELTVTAAGGSSSKQYRLKDKTATLMVRPRGWHLIEAHIVVDGSDYQSQHTTAQPPHPSSGEERRERWLLDERADDLTACGVLLACCVVLFVSIDCCCQRSDVCFTG